MTEMLKSKEDIPENPKRRDLLFKLLATGVALGASACATTAQNSEPKSSEVEGARPEWVGGPKTFEEDGYVYATGSYGYTDDDRNNEEYAIGRANLSMAKHLNPGEKIMRTDVSKPKCVETWRDPYGRYYALVRIKK